MQRVFNRKQSGFMLLLMIVVLMGLGGVVAASFTQQAKQNSEQHRYLHNQRVLKEAKQALLMYAYNYPNIVADRGPGRLPCPDADNDGVPEVLANCSNIGPVPIVGRFPWAANGLNFYDVRDASGERLWYAVSSSFDNADNDQINTGSVGTISVHDQNNRMLYDNGVNGIAAVIIAPGPEINRGIVQQDRNVLNGDDPEGVVADTDPGIINPVNYLDLFGGRDNADFDNTAGSTDGFILGPIYGPNGDLIVNDQMILITTEEVTRMAQRAALETYRDEIAAWQATVPWGVDPVAYPWLNDYDDVVALGDLDLYDVVPGGDSAGRVPFLNYFEDHDSHTVVMDLLIDYDVDFNLTDIGVDGGGYMDEFDNAFGLQQLSVQNAYVSVIQQEPGGVNNSTDNLGTLRSDADLAATATVLVSAPTITRTLYFWDGCGGCFEGADGWELCALPATNEGDCARTPAGGAFLAFTGDWDDHADIRIRFVRLDFNIDAEFEIGLDYAQALVQTPPTAPTNLVNARRVTGIQALINDMARHIDEDGAAGEDVDFIHIEVDACEQDNFVGSNYNVPSFNPDGDSYDCAVDIDLNDVPVVNQFDVTLDYYPELPVWVRNNRWNDSIVFAYAPDHVPQGGGDCTVTAPCLTVNNDFDGSSNLNIALLVGANAQPANVGDLVNIFDLPNNVPQEAGGGLSDGIYDANPTAGDDTLLIVSEN